jgi:hypothetical protein
MVCYGIDEDRLSQTYADRRSVTLRASVEKGGEENPRILRLIFDDVDARAESSPYGIP